MASILNVDKIRATGSTTDGLTVDSSGRVSMPVKPAFSAVRVSSQALNNSTVVCDTVITNVGGHYSGSTGQFTCPIAGLYQFHFECMGNSSTGGHDYFAKINGTTSQHLLSVRPVSVNNADVYASKTSSAGVAVFAAGDTVEVFSPQNVTIYSDGNSWVKFCGYFIG